MVLAKKPFIKVVMATLLIAGCGGKGGVVRQCGSPCPHITPKTISKQSLLETYRASAIGRDLPLKAQEAAARALQDLLRTGDYRHETRWQLPNLPEYVGSAKGHFSLLTVRQEKAVPCITYFQEIIYSDKTLRAHGKACRQRSGLWRIIEEHPFGTR